MTPGNDLVRGSIGERLITTDGRPSGFDYLRLGLAVAVAIVHSRGLTQTVFVYSEGIRVAAWAIAPVRGLSAPVVPMFFALSGFLVAGSLERSKTLVIFLGLRVIRIYPALAVEVLLSAFLIGAVVTSLPLASYFRDPLFWKYLLNVIGDIQYTLPGVFENNPYPRIVNGQLWTVPYELLCYVTLAGLVLGGAVQHKILIPLATVGLALAHLIMRLHENHWQLPGVGVSGHSGLPDFFVVLFFLSGVSLYLYRDKIAWSYNVFFSALMASIPLVWFVPLGEYPAALTIPYVTVYLGLTNFKRLSVIKGADYSYGIYLYHAVIVQLFVHIAAPSSGWITVLVCVPLSALVAAFSWHFIEKPAQNLRKSLPVAERHYLTFMDRLRNRVGDKRKAKH